MWKTFVWVRIQRKLENPFQNVSRFFLLNLCHPPWRFKEQEVLLSSTKKSLHIIIDSPPFNLSVDLHIKKKLFLCSLKCIPFNFFRFFGKNHETLFFSLCYQPWSFILSFIHSYIHSFIHSPSPRRFHWGIIYENRSYFPATSQTWSKQGYPWLTSTCMYIHIHIRPYSQKYLHSCIQQF